MCRSMSATCNYSSEDERRSISCGPGEGDERGEEHNFSISSGGRREGEFVGLGKRVRLFLVHLTFLLIFL